ncbi:DUF6056 family protein [Enterobacter kobei]|uniref:DUF6056 family protein n=1 Tax=Enterobacter kobei TaxID=208224 RepID=UPI000A5429B8|nr:DUF6056 family protein [Enterobacter kobei]MBO4156222.1 hypothetical protein [Enterobacter kobei]MCK7361403.1 DUF6056 family protein [Enterobacter kobei]MDC7947204.1 DUF6056 family protein [Enterobacter kobei]HDW1093032.1 hypothetical protein [Enterobacter kobei]HED5664982.1 hypothetical protein [Enterobacter kobei]
MCKNYYKVLKWTIPGYLLILAIALLTPLHSDDFGTRIGGFPNFLGHYHRYLTWSGRLTADYIASYILWMDSHFMRSAFNAIGTYGLIIALAKLPFSLKSKKINLSYVVIFYVIMSIAWTCSPNLGQTSFWIVGSTNYVWTNLFIIILINILLGNLISTNKHSISFYITVFLLSVVAGCSNENMSLVIFGVCSLYLLFVLFFNKPQIKLGAISLIGAFIGAAVLLLAPGNFRRMSMEGEWWQNATWGYKLWLWAFKKMPFVLQVDWPVVMFIAILLSIAFSTRKARDEFYNNRHMYFAIPFFIFLAFIANLIMIGSPAYPARATNGQFIMLLGGLSFATFIALENSNKKLLIPILSILFLTSTYAYSLMARSYYFVAKQEVIRQYIMNKERSSFKTSATIPEYKFRHLFNEGDKFDMFKPKQLPYFFGLKDVSYINPNFDYSVINTEGTKINIDLNGYAKGIESWVYNDQILRNDYVIVIMLDHYNKDVWSKHDAFIGKSKSVMIDGKRYTLKSEPGLYAINGKAYFALNIGSNKIKSDIKKIDN